MVATRSVSVEHSKYSVTEKLNFLKFKFGGHIIRQSRAYAWSLLSTSNLQNQFLLFQPNCKLDGEMQSSVGSRRGKQNC